MKKRWLTGISMVMLVAMVLSMTAFAAENNENEENPYLYFVDGVQVDETEYPHHEQLCSETSEQHKALAVSEDNWDYYIVSSDGIEKVSKEEYDATFDVHSEISTISTGSWYFTDTEIKSGKTIYYYQTNGDKFVVAADEYIQLTIDVAQHARSFGVGYTGTSYQKEYIDLPKGKGAVIAFIDDIKVPGTYSVFIENSGESTETVSGDIVVKKR